MKRSQSLKWSAAATSRLLLAVIVFSICGLLIGAGFFYARLTSNLPSIEQLPVLLDRQNGEFLQPTRLMDNSGMQILATLENPGVERRFLTVDPDQPDHFSLQLLRAVVAELDPSFWSSNGVASQSLFDPQPHTLAERLAKDLLLADNVATNLSALQMRLLANQLISHYGRTQVLEWYLNSAYFGHLAYGAESAAQFYLHKSASDLDLAEAALLVALIQSPALNPADAPVAALENQQRVLKDLADHAVIKPEEYTNTRNEKITFAPAPANEGVTNAAFIALVKEQLITTLGSTRVERGGLVVTTTLNLDLQNQLLCASRSQLLQIETPSDSGVAADNTSCPAANLLPTQSFSYDASTSLGTAGLIMDPQTGQVLAYTEPITLNGTIKNATYQPGSLLSPFVALAAFARGVSPASLVWDVPTSLPVDLSNQANPDGHYHGAVNVRSALANDYLVPVAQLLEQIDPLTVWSTAAAAGLTSPKQQSASAQLLFGGGKTSLLELGEAYATLANNGSQTGLLNPETGNISPIAILRVQSSTGQTLIDNTQPQRQSIFSTSLTYLINNVLSDETARWSSLGYPNALEIGRPAAAKIGEVSSKDQVWTVGYTPYRLVLTWIGNDTENIAANPLDPRMAAGLWHALIQYTSQKLPADDWQQPADVSTIQVCSPSGMLPTADCPTITTDVFLAGNEPVQADTLYQKIKVNRETGLLATVFTAPELIEEHVFINVPSAVREWASAAGLAIAPVGYDAIPMTQTNSDVQITSPALFAPVSGKVNITGIARGDSFASYNIQIGQGINPESWQQIGQTVLTPISGGLLAEWNSSGLDGLYAIRLNVVHQDNQIKTTVIQVTVDNTPPQARISYPLANAKIKPINGQVTLSAEVSDQVGISRVEWWLDGKKIAERTAAPYTILWASTRGNHALQVKAWDTAGNLANSETIPFEIIP